MSTGIRIALHPAGQFPGMGRDPKIFLQAARKIRGLDDTNHRPRISCKGGPALFFYCLSLTLSLFPYIPSIFLHVWRWLLKFIFQGFSFHASSLLSLFLRRYLFSLPGGNLPALRRAAGSGLPLFGSSFAQFLGCWVRKSCPLLPRFGRFFVPFFRSSLPPIP